MQLPERLRARRTQVALAGAALVVVVAGAGIALLVGREAPVALPSSTPVATPSPTVEPTPTHRPTPSPTPSPAGACPLNGMPVADAELLDRVPMLVQIENNPIARPPSGLNLADLVIEAPVEGNTTRFNAVYACNGPLEAAVGPIRSARYFNVHLWQQLHGLTFVFGGGGPVLNRFVAHGMPYVNGLEGGYDFFIRAGPWGAPHNVYLDVDAARSAVEPGGWLEPRAAWAGERRAPLGFDEDAMIPETGRAVASVELHTASIWRFGWEWDEPSGQWLRTDAGEPNHDALTGERLSARSVLVQVVLEEVYWNELDASGSPRRDQLLIGEGHGYLYVDGHVHDVSWWRPTADDLTTWTFTADEAPLVLPPGRVWWEIVPLGTTIVER
jgi:hypothetical protein